MTWRKVLSWEPEPLKLDLPPEEYLEPNGEYYVGYDRPSGSWCVFHSVRRPGHAFSSWASEEQAQEDAEQRNRDQSRRASLKRAWEVVDGRSSPGVGRWLVKIDVSPEFQRASDEPQGEEFLSLRNAIVAALKEARPLLEKRLMFPLQQLGTYDHLTNRLSKTRSLNNFNGIWDALYDWADRSRVWINTF